MMMKKLFPIFLGIGVIGTPSSMLWAQEERTEVRSVELVAGSNLRVQNRNGRIQVQGWDREEVALKATILDSPERRVNLIFRKQGKDLEVEARAPESGWLSLGVQRTPRCQMTLQVPRHLSAAFRTVNGDIQVAGINGFVECSTTNGDLRLDELSGEVRGETTNGSIEARHLKARIKGGTTHGAIRLLDVAGGIRMETTHGNIRAEQLDGWGEGISLGTTHGDISVILGQASGEIQAENTHGELSIRPANTLVELLEAEKHHVRVRVPGKKQQILLETTHGSISVR